MAIPALGGVQQRTRNLAEHVVARGIRSVGAKRRRPLLLVGHPRSGTGYAAALLRQWGLDVEHERVGRHGISAWYAFCERTPPYCNQVHWDTYEFDTVIHVVRQPRTAVPSIAFTESPTERFRMDELGLQLSNDRISDAIASLEGWTHLIRSKFSIDYVFRIETDTWEIYQELEPLIDLPMRYKPFDKIVNSRKQRYNTVDLTEQMKQHEAALLKLEAMLGY